MGESHNKSRSKRVSATNLDDRRTITVQGIQRHPRASGTPRPLTELQQAVLDALSAHVPVHGTELAASINRPRSGVAGALYALHQRGLAERAPNGTGWRASRQVQSQP